MVQRTIFDQPLVHGFFRGLSGSVLRWRGWRIEGKLPAEESFLAIISEHTSNWDFIIGLAVILHFRLRVFWLGKHVIFQLPFGQLMRWLGGIAVDRSNPGSMVKTLADRYQTNQKFVLVMAPEGTRSNVKLWKTGFYRIAKSAEVPVVLAYIDYRRKVAGLGPTIYISDDQDADIETMRKFYVSITGKHSDKSL